MRRNTLLVDALIAVLCAAIVLIAGPGLAIVGILALLVLGACAASLVVDGRRRRRLSARGRPAVARVAARTQPRGPTRRR